MSKEERGRVISADSEVKEAAFAIFDFMASPEGRVLDLYGVEGFHYNIVDNKIVPIEGAPDWYGVFYDSLIGLENIPYEADAPMGEAGLTSLDIASEYFLADNAVTLPSEYSAYWDAMISLFNEYAVDVIRGDKNTDSDWNAFVEAWNAAGADKTQRVSGDRDGMIHILRGKEGTLGLCAPKPRQQEQCLLYLHFDRAMRGQ